MPEQVGGRAGAGRHPAATVDLEQEPVDGEGATDALEGASGHLLRLMRPGTGKEDDELVPAQPCEDGVAAELVDEARGHRGEQRVPDVVPQRVVDLLEAVEVDQRDSELSSFGHRGVDLLHESRPVEQPGQGVVPDAVAELRLGQPPGIDLRLELVGPPLAEDHHQHVREGEDEDDVVDRAAEHLRQVPGHAGRAEEPGQQEDDGGLAEHSCPQGGDAVRPLSLHHPHPRLSSDRHRTAAPPLEIEPDGLPGGVRRPRGEGDVADAVAGRRSPEHGEVPTSDSAALR
ncbi:hypothetical protein U6N30_03970 [Blastococcus brunescens]|uniref:Uncharacterized protein n=1 Tax=Blastococcus brunescens TaxID=1564165 RepID=A0ABZ1B275_9ACTN|nr:hypothetical protein [Blastococcus sp. BMG 8361]WRL64903.1 hypothetical protein U6N30_03970 [Blastococcus sp. BMG 8361]